MEFPPNLAGEKIVCPHCNKLTHLGSPPVSPPPLPTAFVQAAPALPHQAAYVTTQSTGKGIKAGMALVALGIVVSIVLALANPVWWVAVFALVMGMILLRGLKWWQHE